jgi:hypothetical protein
MTVRRPEVWILAATVLLAAWWFSRPPPPQSPHPEPSAERRAPAFAALPPGAELVVRADLAALRETALGASLFGGGRELAGLGTLTELCGFDPTEQIEELVIAVPPARGSTGEPSPGIVATGPFDPARVLGCVARVIGRRGGTPVETRFGELVSIRDQRNPGAEVAVRAGGPVLVGEGAYFRSMLDAAEGRSPTLLGDQAHATLRRALDGAGAATLTFVARPGWLERWLSEDQPMDTPLADVRAGALSLEVTPNLGVTLLLSCPAEAQCEKLAGWLAARVGDARERLRTELGADPVTSLKVRAEPHAARLQLSLDAATTQRLLLAALVAGAAGDEGAAEPAGDAGDAH